MSLIYSLKGKQKPASLLKLKDPPQELFYQGDRELLQKNYIAIVGARDIESWVQDWMEFELLPTLKACQIGVISGGARGVDQWAHRLSLRAEQPTIVVLPCGVKNKYPATLYQIEKNPNVGFLSEYAPEVQMRKHFFYKRNRLIAALSKVTLVLQASERSGTMITAKYATDLGNTLGVLPANPLNPKFNGNNQLLYDGAPMIRNQKDLMQLITSS